MKELTSDQVENAVLLAESNEGTGSQPANSNSLKIDYYNVKKAALTLRAVNHKLRQQLISLIDEEKKITVTEIYVRLRLEQSVASQHLAILRKAGVVITERDGKFIYYLINYKRLEEIGKIVNELVA